MQTPESQPSPGGGISEGERGANKTHCVSLVQSKCQDKDSCRCLCIWTRCCLATASQERENWKPIAYASKSMSETEKRYSQIEEEALALVWTCEKFADYVIGKQIQIETDHKPLVPLLGTTQRDSLPPRVLRFQLRLTRFDYSIAHVPGMYFYTADTLSRALIKSVDAYMRMTKMSRDSSKRSWNNYQQVRREWNSSVYKAQKDDPICSTASSIPRTDGR